MLKRQSFFFFEVSCTTGDWRALSAVADHQVTSLVPRFNLPMHEQKKKIQTTSNKKLGLAWELD